jgi:hypothetical protein
MRRKSPSRHWKRRRIHWQHCYCCFREVPGAQEPLLGIASEVQEEDEVQVGLPCAHDDRDETKNYELPWEVPCEEGHEEAREDHHVPQHQVEE